MRVNTSFKWYRSIGKTYGQYHCSSNCRTEWYRTEYVCLVYVHEGPNGFHGLCVTFVAVFILVNG